MPTSHPHVLQLYRITAVSCALAVLFAGRASAESADEVRAEALFREGRVSLASGDLDHACPALAGSVAIERATGALLALALCHERQGKLNTAAREYTEVAERSHAQQREDRARAARERLRTLAPKLSALVLTAVEVPSGLEVRVNGKLVHPAHFGESLPVDGGDYVIEANAPQRKPWSMRLTVGAQADKHQVVIPALELVEAPAPLRSPAPRSSPQATHRADTGLTTTQWAGIATLGAGAIAAATGGVLVFHAVGKNHDSERQCEGNLCTLDGRRDRLYARDAGNAATLAFVTTGALVAAGAVLYFVGGKSAPEAEVERRVSANIWAAPGLAGASVRGAF